MSNLSFCFVGDRAFFLDQRGDRYFCLGTGRSASLERALSDPNEGTLFWARNFGDLVALCADGEIPQQFGSLDLSTDTQGGSAQGRFSVTARLAWKYFQARKSLQIRGFDATIAAVRKAKAEQCLQDASWSQQQLLGAAVVRLGYWTFIGDHCLPISIAVAHLMISLRLNFTFILGVKSGPFAAHAWIQCGSSVLTCPLSEAVPYQPILAL